MRLEVFVSLCIILLSIIPNKQI